MIVVDGSQPEQPVDGSGDAPTQFSVPLVLGESSVAILCNGDLVLPGGSGKYQRVSRT